MVVKIYRQGRRCLTNKNTPGRVKPRKNVVGVRLSPSLPHCTIHHPTAGGFTPRD
jgi:hypothetical protein